MGTILQKLILKRWYKSFIGATVILLLLLTAANLISGLLRGNVTTREVFLNYLLELPISFNRILPTACLVASLFSLHKLRQHNELTAIFASGFSRFKFSLIIVLAATWVALAQLIIAAYCSPLLKAQRKVFMPGGEAKFRHLKSKGLRANTIGSGKIWYKGTHYFFSFLNYNRAKKTLADVSLFSFDKHYKLKRQIQGKRLVHQRDKTWNFIDGTSYSHLNSEDSFPKVERFKTLSFLLDESPEDFEKLEADITTLGPEKLFSYIVQLKNAGINTAEYEVTLYDKFSQALICIIFALLASTAIFHPGRHTGSLGKNVFFIFVLTILYWLGHSYFLEMGRSAKINPFLACFSIPFLFSIYLSYRFYTNRLLNKNTFRLMR